MSTTEKPAAKGKHSAAKAYKFDAEKRAQFLELMASGVSALTAAETVGVTYSLVRKVCQSDEEFSAAYDAAMDDSTDFLAHHLYRMATEKGVPGNVVAVFGLLKARRPEVWRENMKIEHTGSIEHAEKALPAARERLAKLLNDGAQAKPH
jgi:hypothetical protein